MSPTRDQEILGTHLVRVSGYLLQVNRELFATKILFALLQLLFAAEIYRDDQPEWALTAALCGVGVLVGAWKTYRSRVRSYPFNFGQDEE